MLCDTVEGMFNQGGDDGADEADSWINSMLFNVFIDSMGQYGIHTTVALTSLLMVFLTKLNAANGGNTLQDAPPPMFTEISDGGFDHIRIADLTEDTLRDLASAMSATTSTYDMTTEACDDETRDARSEATVTDSESSWSTDMSDADDEGDQQAVRPALQQRHFIQRALVTICAASCPHTGQWCIGARCTHAHLYAITTDI